MTYLTMILTFVKVSTATSDPYFSHFDPRSEHQSYKDAQQRLEETHREKVNFDIEYFQTKSILDKFLTKLIFLSKNI